MKIRCNKCDSVNLDQGLDGSILCHDCGHTYLLIGKWIEDIKLENMEK